MELGQTRHVDQHRIRPVSSPPLCHVLLPNRNPGRAQDDELECPHLLFRHHICHWILLCWWKEQLCGTCIACQALLNKIFGRARNGGVFLREKVAESHTDSQTADYFMSCTQSTWKIPKAHILQLIKGVMAGKRRNAILKKPMQYSCIYGYRGMRLRYKLVSTTTPLVQEKRYH